jgi:GDP-L-fucose synthase
MENRDSLQERMEKESRIYIAGHRGMVGSSIFRELKRQGFDQLICRTRQELDLLDGAAVRTFFAEERPEFVFVAAAKVGGIHANDSRPAEFIHENLQIQNHLIHEAWRSGVKKLLFLGSSCIYPKLAPQPLKEDYLLTGALEPTNQWYALAKIAGIKMCQAYRQQYGCDFISALPANLYGPNDNYDLLQSHVLPALIRKFHEAKLNSSESVECWGTGSPLREFLFVDDLARACVFLIKHYSSEKILNIGYGKDISILDLAELISDIIGFNGKIIWNADMPDGTPRKLMNCSRIFDLGWKPEIDLRSGIQKAYQAFLESKNQNAG